MGTYIGMENVKKDILSVPPPPHRMQQEEFNLFYGLK